MLYRGLAVPLVLLVILSFSVAQEEAEPPPGQDGEFVKASGEAYFTAQWLADYDRAGWWSADVAMKLPPERLEGMETWFAYREDEDWLVVYGCFADEGKSFKRLIVHRVRSHTEIEELEDLSAGELDVPFARAQKDAIERMWASKSRGGHRFNIYVRKEGKHIEVWALPPVGQGWVILFGVALRWRYTPDGMKFVDEKTWDYGLRGAKPDKERKILIGCTDFEIPSPGDLYTMCRFGSYFKEIAVRCKNYISVKMEMGLVHVHKPSTERFPPRRVPGEDGDKDSESDPK